MVPTAIELERTSHLRLEWDDGVVVSFDISDLRRACPCAGCRSNREKGRPTFADSAVAEATSARLVGSYALGVEWVDGRCTSIFSFEQLRRWAEHPGPSESTA